MSKEDLYRHVGAIFADVFDDDTIELHPDMTANDVLGWDSLSHLRLIAAIEKDLGIKFSTSEFSKAKNVGEFVDIIAEKVR